MKASRYSCLELETLMAGHHQTRAPSYRVAFQQPCPIVPSRLRTYSASLPLVVERQSKFAFSGSNEDSTIATPCLNFFGYHNALANPPILAVLLHQVRLEIGNIVVVS